MLFIYAFYVKLRFILQFPTFTIFYFLDVTAQLEPLLLL